MITEDYISFETAKLLKEKGFNEPTLAYAYRQDMISYYSRPRVTDPLSIEAGRIPLPTLQMAMKWLRKMHQIAIATNCWFGGERYISWHCTIMCYGEELKTQQDVELPYVATYEQACEAAIRYCLENLI